MDVGIFTTHLFSFMTMADVSCELMLNQQLIHRKMHQQLMNQQLMHQQLMYQYDLSTDAPTFESVYLMIQVTKTGEVIKI